MMNRVLYFLGALIVLAGCEFDSSSSDNSRTGSVSVNVSGSYRDANGSYIAQVRGSSGSSQDSASLGTGNGVQATFSGVLPGAPLTSASIFITDGNESFSDADGDGVLVGDAGGTGTITYSSGTVTVNFMMPPPNNQNVSATYSTINPGSAGNPQQGNSGSPVYRFNIVQNGNLIEMTDDIGSSYSGRIEDPFTEFDTGVPRSTVATEEGRVSAPLLTRSQGLSYPAGVEGMVNGVKVRIEGVFKVQVTIYFALLIDTEDGVETTRRYEELFRRQELRLQGSWIEVDTGVSADINAVGPSDPAFEVVQ